MPKLILLPEGDLNLRAAQAVRVGAHELRVIGHGQPDRVAGLDAAALAQRIRDCGLWRPGLAVRLDACWSGVRPDGIAQTLADRLAVTVFAPNTRTLSFGPYDLGPWHSLRIPFTARTLALWRGRWRRFNPQPCSHSSMQIVLADAIPPQPWRNGGGATRELLVWPQGTDWRLRISLADIDRDGPFSAFPGVMRHFAVLEGPGVQLQLADQTLALTPASPPLGFDGVLAPDCRLIDGPTRDLNLMLRGLGEGHLGGMWRAEDGEASAPAGAWRAFFCGGAATLEFAQGGQRWTLAPRSLLWGLAPGAYRLQRQDGAPAFWLAAAEGPTASA